MMQGNEPTTGADGSTGGGFGAYNSDPHGSQVGLGGGNSDGRNYVQSYCRILVTSSGIKRRWLEHLG
jgi:hypothetical protein